MQFWIMEFIDIITRQSGDGKKVTATANKRLYIASQSHFIVLSGKCPWGFWDDFLSARLCLPKNCVAKPEEGFDLKLVA